MMRRGWRAGFGVGGQGMEVPWPWWSTFGFSRMKFLMQGLPCGHLFFLPKVTLGNGGKNPGVDTHSFCHFSEELHGVASTLSDLGLSFSAAGQESTLYLRGWGLSEALLWFQYEVPLQIYV